MWTPRSRTARILIWLIPSESPFRVSPTLGPHSEAIDGEPQDRDGYLCGYHGSMALMEDLDPEEERAIIDPA